MRTRAQRKMEEQTKPIKAQPIVIKKTKKELLQEKNEQLGKAAAGKADGKKKVKDEPAPPQRTRRSNQEKVRVVEQKQSPKKPRGREKSSTLSKKEEQKKQASVQKKADEAKKPRKKVGEAAKESAKEAKQSKSKIAAKDDLNPEPEQEKQVIKTIQYKGKAPIDEQCTLKATNHHILQYQGKVYSSTLNQTSVANNNNKYYILQIVQSDSNPSHCYFFTRWGRVGVKGQISNFGPIPIPAAIREYESKHREKSRKGNYKEVQLNFEVDDKKNANDDEKPSSQAQKDQNKIFSQSKLQEPIKRLIQLIFDLNMMKKQMIQIGYNVKKMPLGQLTERHIQKGFTILKKLMDEIKGKHDSSNIQEFTSEFYTTIPHDFGFSRMINHILDTEQKVKQKIEMLEALSEIKVATSLIDQKKQSENELDSNFKKLQRDVTAINKDTTEFQLINRYLQSTHASTHTSYGLQLVDLFSLSNQAENTRYTKDMENKMLLWHGSRLTNFVGILSQGLRIAPPEAPVTGYMFGKGVYFADMSSKSANYCFTSRESSTGILLLCEVALGGINEKYNADYYAGNLPAGKHSTKGVGRTAPDPANAVKLDDGVVIPMGPGEPTALACTLLYNEFIVYDIAQIKIRYLLRTKFNYQ